VESWHVIAGIAVVSLLLLGRTRKAKPSRSRTPASGPRGTYPGDYKGKVTLEYSPKPNSSPDPGEVVWAWVPFEEDARKGKDRPVLLIGRDGTWLLGLMLSSKDHDNDPTPYGRWMDIGAGPWDRQRRPSEVRLDRIVRIDPRAVRREGATVPLATFDAVSRSLLRLHHW